MRLQKVIAIDFDGCICTEEWPGVGRPNWAVINAAKKEKENGAALVLWTLREGKFLEDALKACESWGLEFDAVNDTIQSWKDAYGNNPRKVGATEYWDDRAVVMGKDTGVAESMSIDAVAKLLNDLMGDCPCNFGGIDEWLPTVCTYTQNDQYNECPDPKEDLGCWKEFLRQYNKRSSLEN